MGAPALRWKMTHWLLRASNVSNSNLNLEIRSEMTGGYRGLWSTYHQLLRSCPSPGVHGIWSGQGAQDKLTKDLAFKFAPKGVRVNSIAPGV